VRQLGRLEKLCNNLQCSRKAPKGVCLLSELEWGVGSPNDSCWTLGRAAAVQSSAADTKYLYRSMSR
jgi:hypothetical protein